MDIAATSGPQIFMSVEDSSQKNIYQNHGQMNVVHGNNNVVQNVQTVVDTLHFISTTLNRSPDAEFDIVTKAQRGACTPETRVLILQDLKNWCRNEAALRLYWMSGMAGTGKTTIAYTLAEYLAKEGILGASFFCTRSVDSCQNVYRIFPSIAFQIARKYDIFAEELVKVLRMDPDIGRRSLDIQLEQLIIKPFKARAAELPTNLVVVLDALDECKADHSRFLEAIIAHAMQLPFKLLLTSRPEYVIHKSMATEAATNLTATFVLHEVEQDLVQADIVKYLTQELSSLSPPPSPATVELLASQAGALFIYAATLGRFILEEDGDAIQRLNSILAPFPLAVAEGVMDPLDALYADILANVFETKRVAKEVDDIRSLLHTVLCLREPLTKRDIAALWNLDEGTVERRLKQLHSILFIPRDPSRPVTTFHTSFPDFMLDKNRSRRFFCDAGPIHLTLTLKCFGIMNAMLRQNICGVNELCPNGNVNHLGVILDRIPPDLSYVCRHWTAHLDESPQLFLPLLMTKSREFIFAHGLHWLECLALIHQLAVCITSLETLMTLAGQDIGLYSIARELHRLVQSSYDCIDYCALEVYRSALTWLPLQSPLRSRYAPLWKGLPEILAGLPLKWTGPDQIIKAHSLCVQSIALSSDGGRIMSGSDDKTVRMWNVNDRREEHVFRGHTDGVTAVAISSDDSLAISGSSDNTLRAWDVAAQIPKFLLKGYKNSVQAIGISQDGGRIWSCDYWGMIHIWQLKGDQFVCVSSSNTHKLSSALFTAAFTRNKKHIIYSGSRDAITYIRDLESGKLTFARQAAGDFIKCVATSPQSDQFVTGSFNGAVKIWNLAGKLLHDLQGHTSAATSVVLFHDGLRAASSSLDRTIRIWDMVAGAIATVLTGYWPIVHSLAVFPDGRRIVSGSNDGSLAIWPVPPTANRPQRRYRRWWSQAQPREQEKEADKLLTQGLFIATSSELLCLLAKNTVHILDATTLEQRTAINVGNVNRLALSPQGTHLAASFDDSLRLWDVAKGRSTPPTECQDYILSIAFSNNSQLLMSASTSGTVRVWGVSSRHLSLFYHLKIDNIRCVAFSQDDTQMAICSGTNLRIHNALLGRLQKEFTLDLHSPIAQISFSMDKHHILINTLSSIHVYDADSGGFVRIQRFNEFKHCTILSSSHIYAYHSNGWLHRMQDPMQPPRAVCWVPPQYRPEGGYFEGFSSPKWDFLSWNCEESQGNTKLVLRFPHESVEPTLFCSGS